MKADDAEVRKELWNIPAIEDFPFNVFDTGGKFLVTGPDYIPKNFNPDKFNVVCRRDVKFTPELHEKMLDGLRSLGLRRYRRNLTKSFVKYLKKQHSEDSGR